MQSRAQRIGRAASDGRFGRSGDGVIVAWCVVGLLVNAVRVPPFKLLYYSAVLNGIISPPLLFVVTQIAGNREIMVKSVNSRVSSIAGYALCGFMSLALIGLLVLLGGPYYRKH